jgi:hypothetical protein
MGGGGVNLLALSADREKARAVLQCAVLTRTLAETGVRPWVDWGPDIWHVCVLVRGDQVREVLNAALTAHPHLKIWKSQPVTIH